MNEQQRPEPMPAPAAGEGYGDSPYPRRPATPAPTTYLEMQQLTVPTAHDFFRRD